MPQTRPHAPRPCFSSTMGSSKEIPKSFPWISKGRKLVQNKDKSHCINNRRQTPQSPPPCPVPPALRAVRLPLPAAQIRCCFRCPAACTHCVDLADPLPTQFPRPCHHRQALSGSPGLRSHGAMFPFTDRAVFLTCADLTAETGQAQPHSRGSVVTRSAWGGAPASEIAQIY